MENRNKKTTKRSIMLMLVAMLLVISLIGGTMAWLTISDSLTNNFTVKVGEVKEPGTPGTDDDNNDGEVDPPYNQDEDSSNPLDGNIYEPNYVDGLELALGKTITKDPYIGIGAGSEASYIFAWWDDNTQYYTDAETKVALEGAFVVTANTSVENDGKWVQVTGTEADTDSGKSALYVWCDASGKPMQVTATDTSAWTGVLFANGEIQVRTDAQGLIDNTGNNTLEVHCFIHQALDGNGEDLYDDVVLAAAKAEWGN